jgi:hypothetical protein
VSESGYIGEWKEHLGLLLGTLSTLFVAVRILSLANFDPETAYGILQARGTAAVIVGALLSSIGLLSLLVSMLCLVSTFFPSSENHKTNRKPLMFAGILFGVVAIFIAPFIWLCISVAFLGIEGLWTKVHFSRLDRRIAEALARNDPDEIASIRQDLEEKLRRDKHRDRSWRPFAVVVTFAIGLGLFSLTASPWYPTEKLGIKDSSPETVKLIQN